MFQLTTVLSTALVAGLAAATPIRSRSPYVVKETHNAPIKWKVLEDAPKDHVIDLQIGVAQSNFDELERHLYEVSDPDHHRYGQHLSHAEVNDLVKPAPEALELVHEWLADHGLTPSSYSAAKDWVMISVPVETAERLLDTKYNVYEHEDGSQVVRTSQWSLPQHLHEHIDAIQPTTSFFRMKAQEATFRTGYTPPSYTPPDNSTINKVCNISSVTPACFHTLYQTKDYTTKAAGKNQIGFTNYLGEHPIRSDAEKFLAKYQPSAVSSAQSFKQLVIANGPGDTPLTPEEAAAGTSREANLDVQAIAGISYATPITSYSTGGSPPFIPDLNTPENTNEPYLVWVNYLLSQPSFPQIITTSYGDDEQTVPYSYALRVCRSFAQVGARGTSLLFSSGDSGVGDFGSCVSNDGKNSSTFLPSFPAGCPYITSVGATKEFAPEVVAYRPAFVGADGVQRGNYTSGGGFSYYFEAPEYQADVVSDYVDNLDGLYDGLYRKDGRGYPDISAQGLYFAYFWNGTEGTISGTSASCPLTGGILSLVNDALISEGKKPLGFLNPWLYKRGRKGLTDVTRGSAVGCGVDGFPAVEGWDPVTGWGTPVLPKLLRLVGVEGKGGHQEDDDDDCDDEEGGDGGYGDDDEDDHHR